MNSITVNFENLTKEEREQLLLLVEKSLVEKSNNKKVPLSEIKIGQTFKIGKYSFIKFSEIDGVVTAVSKESVCKMYFGKNNNFAESDVLKYLYDKVLPKLISAVGEDNILPIETSLTAFDGVKTFGTITSKISLPTLDFYRDNVDIFDKYNVDEYWWLATPWSARPHYNSSCVLGVSLCGFIEPNLYNNSFGVRPFCRFKSSISVLPEY